MRKIIQLKQKLFTNKDLTDQQKIDLMKEIITLSNLEDNTGDILPIKDLEKNDPLTNKTDKEKKTDYYNVISKVMSGKSLGMEDVSYLDAKNLSSVDGSKGGYLIPSDDRQQIQEFARELVDLSTLVNIVPTTTNKGSLLDDKGAEYVPLTNFSEGDSIKDDSNLLDFGNDKFTIKEYGGIIKIPNNLLNDNVAKLRQYINRWLAKRGIATKNDLILKILKTLTKESITKLDDIKTILNVKLDPAIKKTSTIITNQDGFDYLDHLKDSNGKYLLQDNPTKETEKLLFGRPLFPIKNSLLPTATKKLPFVVGDFKKVIDLVDREQLSLLATDQSDEAFTNNQTHVRGIIRFDVVSRDVESAVYSELTIPTPTTK